MSRPVARLGSESPRANKQRGMICECGHPDVQGGFLSQSLASPGPCLDARALWGVRCILLKGDHLNDVSIVWVTSKPSLQGGAYL